MSVEDYYHEHSAPGGHVEVGCPRCHVEALEVVQAALDDFNRACQCLSCGYWASPETCEYTDTRRAVARYRKERRC